MRQLASVRRRRHLYRRTGSATLYRPALFACASPWRVESAGETTLDPADLAQSSEPGGRQNRDAAGFRRIRPGRGHGDLLPCLQSRAARHRQPGRGRYSPSHGHGSRGEFISAT